MAEPARFASTEQGEAQRTEIPDRLVWVLIWALILATVVVILTVGTILVEQTADIMRDVWIFVTIGLVGWCAYLTWRVHQLSEGRDAPRLRDRFAH